MAIKASVTRYWNLLNYRPRTKTRIRISMAPSCLRCSTILMDSCPLNCTLAGEARALPTPRHSHLSSAQPRSSASKTPHTSSAYSLAPSLVLPHTQSRHKFGQQITDVESPGSSGVTGISSPWGSPPFSPDSANYLPAEFFGFSERPGFRVLSASIDSYPENLPSLPVCASLSQRFGLEEFRS